jgi:ADP-heptose:LPS heptosyltransferase
MPEKRYPAELWRELAIKLNRPIVLFGTPFEQIVTASIAKGLPFVTDLAGKTDMASLAENLAACSLVIGNDTGSMHLANAMGVPTVVLYGPTFPERTHPTFNAPYHQIKAPEGKPIGSILPEEIYSLLKEKRLISFQN